MDAGLAAVLGAVVGAVGTGGAGVVAALLARSQARFQLQAEHARIIREPRKAAYTSYAEALLRDHGRLTDAKSGLTVAARHEPSEPRSEILRVARQKWESVRADDTDLEHRYAQVAVEGPRTVTNAAVQVNFILGQFSAQVMECLHDLEQRGSCSPDAIALLEEKRDASYNAYLQYLDAASKAIGVDGITALPE